MKLILLNGPPRCGKDTIGQMLREEFEGVVLDKFARKLKEATHRLYNVRDPRTGEIAGHDYFEHNKGAPQACFFGLSAREAYINVSERYMRPTHGSDIFGRLLALDYCRESIYPPEVLVITDSGFEPEAVALRERLTKDVTVVRIVRPNTSFENDSRSWWAHGSNDKGWKRATLINDGNLFALRTKAVGLLEGVARSVRIA